MKKRYDLKKLTCASCAMKIEYEIANLKSVTFVKVDLNQEKLIVESTRHS